MSNVKLIVVDGMDGTGKGTVIEAVRQRFPGFAFVREPGGTELGEKIRGLFLGQTMQPATEVFLLLAQRSELRSVISALLGQGKTVLSDRSDSSTFAYQVVAREQPFLEGLFWETRKYLVPIPDAYVFLDTDPVIAIERTGRRSSDDRFDSAGLEFFSRVRDGFRVFASKVDTPCHFVDATPNDPTVVSNSVIAVIEQYLST